MHIHGNTLSNQITKPNIPIFIFSPSSEHLYKMSLHASKPIFQIFTDKQTSNNQLMLSAVIRT